ncbi:MULTISPECIES: Rpn family recombination-promoting nuclease/putative transposase [Calothrix]|uniref:Rpn family recombination-promoting nuclease/putative transposase n=2 Tax=Calothrix TaxID=1186 RepID=A0ABR8A9H2_9CYAN|nr:MULTISPECIES: Rpn family recombination-promoting nuclease/putative transposase [Calothrix]MBD2196647.1 Rpn family recombination-promoting nuclease/putative transposase [Calothrix parietina FACHB-288]MBD2224256.1 Rpn family recombination-promoting nuclease/putative transposase [Calothrix anomala FACHB-343]
MKTDIIFYRLFLEIPSIFFELISNHPEEANNYQFASVEIKQTSFRIDGVFLPVETIDKPIYFVEVQFQQDDEIYSRLIAEICLYLRQNKPQNDWNAVVLYPNRNVDTGDIKHYREFFDSQRVRRIYLDELGDNATLPIGIATVKLVIEDKDIAINQARELIARTRQETNSQLQQQLLQLIETILVYKFPNMSREEIEAMFSLSELKQTRFYQEAFQEGKEEGIAQGERTGKLKAIIPMLSAGLTVEQIAQALELSVEEVSQIVQQQASNSTSSEA